MQFAKLIGRSPLVASHAHPCTCFNPNPIQHQSLRWKRKPIWLPTAKTKVFRVPVRPKLPVDEALEIQRLYNNYRTYMKSLRHYFYELAKQQEIQLDESVLEKEEKDDFIRCFEINKSWNEKIAAERIVYQEKQREEQIAKIAENIQLKKKKDEEKRAMVDAKVREAKLISSTFITRENIDQAIEDALANVVSYNKALTPDGQWYTDSSGLPPPKEQVNLTSKRQKKMDSTF
ncbi:hypothetical protein QAD02_022112 [Eretmocerus hayati]|uniref:Uncharacterized protein n=1 Tax=Eretmocerus hayati TaxID=131215 RepID=A0ACC2PS60_9HYME|nr:hypothetical protein QAD02_022112 [Eretmocerus hayati]